MENIIEVKNESYLERIDEKLADMLSRRVYPLIEGLPLCRGNIEHNISLFKGIGKGSKPEICNLCKLKGWCDYDQKKSNFEIKPVEDPDSDLLEFLEGRDEDSPNWF